MNYHVPVLLNESISGLSIKPTGTYIDLTFGGGGHTKNILKLLEKKGKLFSFDTDTDSFKINSINGNNNFEFINSNFKYFDLHLKQRGIKKVDGIFADLGVSSHQIDVLSRGFSYKGKAELDMRMNSNNKKNAQTILNDYDESDLDKIFFNYGDFKNSKLIAKNIVEYRKNKKIKYNLDLIEILNNLFDKNVNYKFLSRLFQSIRIEVNDEINALKEMLLKSKDFLKIKGRLVIISYHSIEDRIVKNFINKSNFDSTFKTDFYGNKQIFFKSINKKPLVPSEEEIKINPRSRSAKLRIGELI
ncbi:MAG TPA: 16S rRNA (cytosine(1402)-N(4))-methyltransferase RsmH [Cytophagales bacterium]|jgi:16S rRNA (cytosine1402-N4)-methyltransferase|nr:16S rRNA (cytosine(1402)-N(4))-methyltransferase RsmH [Cytophagales bacterium]